MLSRTDRIMRAARIVEPLADVCTSTALAVNHDDQVQYKVIRRHDSPNDCVSSVPPIARKFENNRGQAGISSEGEYHEETISQVERHNSPIECVSPVPPIGIKIENNLGQAGTTSESEYNEETIAAVQVHGFSNYCVSPIPPIGRQIINNQGQAGTYLETDYQETISEVQSDDSPNECVLTKPPLARKIDNTGKADTSTEEGYYHEQTFMEDSDCSVADKDYVPEQECSDTDDQENESTENKLATSTKKRVRWKSADRSQWKREKSKRTKIELKHPKDIDCSKCRFKCSTKIKAEVRNQICTNFWNCDFKRRKDFILNNVESHNPERRRQNHDCKKKPRSDSKRFFLAGTAVETKVRVCKRFFIKTLCISKEVVEHAFKKKGTGDVFVGDDLRGKKEPPNKTRHADLAKVMSHIQSFPRMKSHYTRKSTKREYLDCKLTIAKMLALYKDNCEIEACKPVSLITYRIIFCNNYNYSFYKPKKDQCQICMSYESQGSQKTAVFQSKYQDHIARKQDCNSAKVRDKERCLKENNFVCCTFDLQCVLQIPTSDVSPLYYSRKLCTYNLTVYELAPPNNAFCYSWTELNGKRGSLEIGSCLYMYIDQLPSTISELTLYSDTCSGQNRNQNVSAMLLYLVQKNPNIISIEQKYLESGHSYMEVDSMHSAIEKAQKYVPVYTMHDWLTIFRMARTSRSNKAKYNVRELKYSDFLDLEQLAKSLVKNRMKDTLGEKVNWLKVKCFRYLKCKPGILQYRYDHTSEYREINVLGKGKRRPSISDLSLKNAYKNVLPISINKKKDLKLCSGDNPVIPLEFHHYYRDIPTAIMEDIVPEPAMEDSDLEGEEEC